MKGYDVIERHHINHYFIIIKLKKYCKILTFGNFSSKFQNNFVKNETFEI